MGDANPSCRAAPRAPAIDRWFPGEPGDAPLLRRPEDIPAVAGAYVLAVALTRPLTITICGATQGLQAGLYLYCGSARGPGGLRARIARHMRPDKPVHWHIDRLTRSGKVLGAWAFPGGDECALARSLAPLPVPIAGFGSSDCRQCRSHLFYWPGGTRRR